MIFKAEGPFPSGLSLKQKSLLLGMQIVHPQKILVCFRQRRGRWSPSVFLIGRTRFYPKTMDSLWRRGLVQYEERPGGDRYYTLTQEGFKLPA